MPGNRIRFNLLIISLLFVMIASCLQNCTRSNNRFLTHRYEFDKTGRLAAEVSPEGARTAYTHDARHNITAVDYDGVAEVDYAYDHAGRCIWMRDPEGTTEYYYDALGRLQAVISQHSPYHLVEYQYDALGNVTCVRVLDLTVLAQEGRFSDYLKHLQAKLTRNMAEWGERQTAVHRMLQDIARESRERMAKYMRYQSEYQYDLMRRVTRITWQGRQVDYVYDDAARQVTRRLPNGVHSTFTFGNFGELKSLRHVDRQQKLLREYRYYYGTDRQVQKIELHTPENIDITTYAWHAFGQIGEIRLPDGETIHYQYNEQGRCISRASAQGVVQFQYDAYGRLQQAGDVQYHWNRNGQLTEIMRNDDPLRFYYNAQGRPVRIETPAGAIRYRWDGAGNLIGQSNPQDEMIHLVPDYRRPGGEALAGLNEDNALVYSNLYDNDLIGRENTAGEQQYLLENGLNQIRRVSNGDGQIVGRQYQHYGPGLTEVELRKLEPEYYAMIDDLENAPDFITLYNRLRAGAGEVLWYFGAYVTAIGQIVSFDPGVIGVLGSILAHLGDRTRQGVLDEIRKIEGMGYVADRYSRPQQWMGLYNDVANAGNLVKDGVDVYAAYRLGGRAKMGIEARKQGLDRIKEIAGKYAVDVFIDRQLMPPNNPIARFLKGVFRPKDIAPPDDEDDTDNEDLYSDTDPGPPLPCPPFCSDGNKEEDDDDDDCPPYCPDDDDHGPCPPFCDDGGPPPPPGGGPPPPPPGGGGAAAGTGKLERDPYRDIERELGGIELSAAAEFSGTPGRFTGAMFDPETETLLLLGESDRSVPGINPQDLAVALALAYGTPPQDAQFSLDPADPQNPQGEWLKAVYLPEDILAGTSFGNTMFETDWLLKQYAFGVQFDENERQQARKSSVAGYKSTVDLSFERDEGDEEADSAPHWSRFWIVSDRMVLQESGNTIRFAEARMRIKTRKQVVDPTSPTGLRDVDTEDDPISMEFARRFTAHYDEIARETPEFERLRGLAKAVALAKWMKANNIPVDSDWINRNINRRVKSIGRITALSTQWQRESRETVNQAGRSGVVTTTRTIHIFGGVDLTVNAETEQNHPQAAEMGRVVRQKLLENPNKAVFSYRHDQKPYLAVVAPFSGRGADRWNEQQQTVQKDGRVFELDSLGRLATQFDGRGNLLHYHYRADGRFDGVTIDYASGKTARYTRTPTGAVWEFPTAPGNIRRYHYDLNGDLAEVTHNGEIWAAYVFNPQQRSLTVEYSHYRETYQFNSGQRLVYYEIAQTAPNGQAMQSGRVRVEYDGDGNLQSISGDRIPRLNITREKSGSNSVVSINSPEERLQLVYDSAGQIREVKSTDLSARIEYRQGKPHAITLQDAHGKEDYGFNTDGTLNTLSRNGMPPQTYHYDENGMLQEVSDPDSSRIGYQYQLDRRSGGTAAGVAGIRKIFVRKYAARNP